MLSRAKAMIGVCQRPSAVSPRCPLSYFFAMTPVREVCAFRVKHSANRPSLLVINFSSPITSTPTPHGNHHGHLSKDTNLISIEDRSASVLHRRSIVLVSLQFVLRHKRSRDLVLRLQLARRYSSDVCSLHIYSPFHKIAIDNTQHPSPFICVYRIQPASSSLALLSLCRYKGGRWIRPRIVFGEFLDFVANPHFPKR